MFMLNDHIYKALLNRLTSDKFVTLSTRNFYHQHNFYNLLMSSPYTNDSIDSPARFVLLSVKNTRLQRLSLAFCSISTKGQIRIQYARKTKSTNVTHFQLLNYSLYRLLASKIFNLGKYCNYPLTTT